MDVCNQKQINSISILKQGLSKRGEVETCYLTC